MAGNQNTARGRVPSPLVSGWLRAHPRRRPPCPRRAAGSAARRPAALRVCLPRGCRWPWARWRRCGLPCRLPQIPDHARP